MTNASRRRQIGDGGQAFYQRHFDWPVLAAQLRRALAPSEGASRSSPDEPTAHTVPQHSNTPSPMP
jgi:hypothetical protein